MRVADTQPPANCRLWLVPAAEQLRRIRFSAAARQTENAPRERNSGAGMMGGSFARAPFFTRGRGLHLGLHLPNITSGMQWSNGKKAIEFD